MKRVIVITVLVIAAVVVGLTAYLSLAVKPEKYQPLIERTLSEKVGRKVTMGKMDFSLWGGLAFEVSDLKVSGDKAHPDEYPLAFGAGKFKMRIFPLLLGEVRIKEVVVDSPVLFLRKYRDGRLSIDDMREKLESGEKEEKGKESSGKKPLKMEVDTVRVSAGSVTFLRELAGGKVEKTTVTPVNVRMSQIGFGRKVSTDISLRISEPLTGAIDLSGFLLASSRTDGEQDVSLSLSGKILDLPAKIDGKVSMAEEKTEFDGTVTADNIEINRLAKIYSTLSGKEIPLRSEGKGAFSLAARGTPDAFNFNGEMDLGSATLLYGNILEKDAASELALIFQGRYVERIVIISKAECRLPDLVSSINGKYNIGSGLYELQSSFEVARLESVSRIFKGLSQFTPSGRVTTSALVRGKGGALQSLTGKMDLAGVSLEVPGKKVQLSELTGQLEFGKDAYAIKLLTGLLNGRRVSLSGKLLMKEQPKGEFNAKADFLDVDALLGTAARGGGKEKGPGPKKSVPGVVKKADISAKVVVDKMRYRGVDLHNAAGTLRLRNGKVEWEGIEVGLFAGKIQTAGSAGLFAEDRPFQISLDSKNVSLLDFFKSLTSYGGFMGGAADLKLALSGDASSVGNMRKTLSGKGEIAITSGMIEGVDLLSDIGKVAGIQNALAAYTGKGTAKRSVTVFDSLFAPFEIKGGEAIVKNFLFKTSTFNLKGVARLTAENRFAFSGDAVIPRAIAGKAAGIEKFVTDDQGNLIIPLSIAGPLTGPTVSLDAKGLLERKKEDIIEREKKKIERKILDTIKEKKVF